MQRVPPRLLLLVAGALALLAAPLWMPSPERTLWWRTLFNAGHAPVFGLLALIAHEILQRVRPSRDWPRARLYLVAAAVATR